MRTFSLSLSLSLSLSTSFVSDGCSFWRFFASSGALLISVYSEMGKRHGFIADGVAFLMDVSSSVSRSGDRTKSSSERSNVPVKLFNIVTWFGVSGHGILGIFLFIFFFLWYICSRNCSNVLPFNKYLSFIVTTDMLLLYLFSHISAAFLNYISFSFSSIFAIRYVCSSLCFWYILILFVCHFERSGWFSISVFEFLWYGIFVQYVGYC